ncbi:hypothetical protein BDW22DRAFT_258069 [Trametopsis cervina]|nr:hypothetical protein BDW22DRAFT_258069 [Trametopsis cervina]
MSRSLVNPSPVVGRAPIPPSEENPDCIQQTNSVTRRPRSGLRNKKGRPPGLPANEGQAPRDIDPSAHGPAVSAMTESGTNVDQVPSTVDNDDTADQVALQHPPTPDVAGSEPRKQAQHNVPTSHPRADGSIEDLAASFHNAIRATQTLSVEFQAERKELRAMQSVLEKRLQAEIGQRSALELRVRAADQEILSLKVQHRQLEAQLRHEIERGSQAALGDGGQEVISQEMTAHMRSLAEEVVKAQIDQLQATHRSQPETPSSPSNLDNELVAIFRKSIPSMMENVSCTQHGFLSFLY